MAAPNVLQSAQVSFISEMGALSANYSPDDRMDFGLTLI